MADGRAAIGVIVSEWNGSSRLDRRWAPAQPVLFDLTPPRGVDADIWAAAMHLRALINDQEQTARPGRPT